MKNLTNRLQKDNELVIGLNGKTRYQNTKNIVEDDELESISDRNRTLQMAQVELSKAHQKYQQYLQNKYNNSAQVAKVQNNALENIRKGIAIKISARKNQTSAAGPCTPADRLAFCQGRPVGTAYRRGDPARNPALY